MQDAMASLYQIVGQLRDAQSLTSKGRVVSAERDREIRRSGKPRPSSVR